MNSYEGLFIIKPDLKEAEAAGALKAVADFLSKNKAEIKKEDNWGKRQFAYPIKKFRDGIYYKVEFDSPPQAISKLKEACALNADILRVMITKR